MEAMQRAMATKVYQDFVPPTELVEEPECDTLLVYLPGYKKEQLRVQLTKTRNLVVSGEHPVGENAWRRFQKTIPISSNCDIGKITAKFEDSILYITQPKLIASAETHDKKKPTSNQEDLTQEQDQENPTSTKAPEPYKYVDKNEDTKKVKDVVDQKQADNTNVERKETAKEKENVKKLSEMGKISQDVVDNDDAKSVTDKISNVNQTEKTAETGETKGKGDNDAKSVADKISSVKQTKQTAETREMKGNGDQKQKTYSGYFATKLNIRKEVINIIIAILVAIAFGLQVKYSVESWKKVGKEDV